MLGGSLFLTDIPPSRRVSCQGSGGSLPTFSSRKQNPARLRPQTACPRQQPGPASLPPSHGRAAYPAAAAHPRPHSPGREHQARQSLSVSASLSAGAGNAARGVRYQWRRPATRRQGDRGLSAAPPRLGTPERNGGGSRRAVLPAPAVPGRDGRVAHHTPRRPVAVTSHAAAPSHPGPSLRAFSAGLARGTARAEGQSAVARGALLRNAEATVGGCPAHGEVSAGR